MVDPTINADYMEMYADEDSRGGVLEPEGIVNIKFRRDRQLETMARLDAQYGQLKSQLADKSLTKEKQDEIKAKMTERENLLLPVYSQISLQFADLHDRAGRMQAKNTIRHPLQWKNARRFFYWRVRRRLNEEQLLRRLAKTSKEPRSRAATLTSIRAWSGIHDFEHDDRAVATWYEDNRKNLNARVEAIKSDGVAFDVAAMLSANKEGGMKGLKQYLDTMPVQEREEAFKYLKG